MEGKSIVLSDNRKILLNDDNDILISIISGGEIVHTFEAFCPSGGYGGGALLLSPSEQYLLFSYYSGESEEGYMIFKIHNSCLECVYDCGYLCGEGASYVFSDNEEFLFQALPESVGPFYAEDAESDENGDLFFELCQINRLDIQNKTIDRHILRVFLPEHWDEDMAEEEPPRLTGIKDNRALCMAMAWGEEELAFPLEDVIVFRPE